MTHRVNEFGPGGLEYLRKYARAFAALAGRQPDLDQRLVAHGALHLGHDCLAKSSRTHGHARAHAMRGGAQPTAACAVNCHGCRREDCRPVRE